MTRGLFWRGLISGGPLEVGTKSHLFGYSTTQELARVSKVRIFLDGFRS
jgi:hypothetical protein